MTCIFEAMTYSLVTAEELLGLRVFLSILFFNYVRN